MQMHLHPTRREALTASDTAITRWSLETNPATILAQMSTAWGRPFPLKYDPEGRMMFLGGITCSPDGTCFALSPLRFCADCSALPGRIEWRSFDDLLLIHTREFLKMGPVVKSLASSPDGRWLVIGSGYAEQLFLLDWQTGEVVSHHATNADNISGLTFDPTSTFIAGFFSHQGGATLQLWRLDEAERFVPRPAMEQWPTYKLVQQDFVSGSKALTLMYSGLDVGVPGYWVQDLRGTAAFSPDGRLVVFSYHIWPGFRLLAYEVASGERLWLTSSEIEKTGPFIFSPDGSVLLVPAQSGDLLVYSAEDGALIQRLSTGLGEPVQALAFDHDGKTLWLATQEKLVRFQPQG